MKTKRKVGRPTMYPGGRKIAANFALSRQHHAKLRFLATSKNLSMSQLLAHLIDKQ